ncbi:MAG: hypothetical protein Q8Q96_00380 [bacterium]|nr:hypothetical protein [bacterium]
MSSERRIPKPEGRRTEQNVLRGIAAAAIIFALGALSGCADKDFLSRGANYGNRPQATSGLEMQYPPIGMGKEDADNLAGTVGLIATGALLLFLTVRRRF